MAQIAAARSDFAVTAPTVKVAGKIRAASTSNADNRTLPVDKGNPVPMANQIMHKVKPSRI
ncbi:MAG TPA: hypothetical protein PKD99_03210 [Sphingopyxis sp.]|nr:hypothetical protein [Sphingopyxis sp.]HMP44089.1 hypothetical protein [Sphingopyxis sp.]HMQ19106.1 hypothetical protein [Sphingopyxis sp.]